MRRVLLFLLAGAVSAGAPGYKEIFDPFDPAFPTGQSRTRLKQQAFDRAVASSGPARAVKQFRGFEKALGAVQKRLDADHATYRKISAEWWAWRRKYERDQLKKLGRPAAEYPIPKGLNDDFIAKELRFRRSRSLKLRERLFQNWVMARTAGLLAGLEGPARAKAVARVAAELRQRPPQALRAARLLVAMAATAEIDRALGKTRHPAVLAALLEGASWPAAKRFLAHPAWPVRAGAARAAKRVRSRAAAVALAARLPAEKGRLRDDLTDALIAITGRQGGDWSAWLASRPDGWTPPPAPQEEPDPAVASGVRSAGAVSCFGIRTSSRRIVYCIEDRAPLRDEVSRSVASLPDGALFGVVVYAGEAEPFRKGLIAATAASRAALDAFLGKERRPGDGVDLHAGLARALDLAGGKGNQPPAADTLFLATISGPQAGLYEDPRQVMLEINARNALKGLRIHAYGRSQGRDAYYLQFLCRPFGGTHKG